MVKSMRKMKSRIVFYLLSCGVLGLILFILWFQSFNAKRGYWEAEIENEGPQTTLTLRLIGREKKSLRRQIVFENIEADAIQPGTFKLPDEADQMSGARMTFEDITLRPGRVTFEWQGHEIDMMPSRLIIDGKDYGWDKPEPILIVD